MNEQNRVLVRKGARELSHQEVERVTGGIGTLTACTANPCNKHDGDASIGECGTCN